jgi:hypothetical protein
MRQNHGLFPTRFLNQLATSDEHPPTTVAAASSHAVLFEAENEVRNMGETTCSGTTLTKLRAATFAQLYKSVDDPAGLMQTMTLQA